MEGAAFAARPRSRSRRQAPGAAPRAGGTPQEQEQEAGPPAAPQPAAAAAAPRSSARLRTAGAAHASSPAPPAAAAAAAAAVAGRHTTPRAAPCSSARLRTAAAAAAAAGAAHASPAPAQRQSLRARRHPGAVASASAATAGAAPLPAVPPGLAVPCADDKEPRLAHIARADEHVMPAGGSYERAGPHEPWCLSHGGRPVPPSALLPATLARVAQHGGRGPWWARDLGTVRRCVGFAAHLADLVRVPRQAGMGMVLPAGVPDEHSLLLYVPPAHRVAWRAKRVRPVLVAMKLANPASPAPEDLVCAEKCAALLCPLAFSPTLLAGGAAVHQQQAAAAAPVPPYVSPCLVWPAAAPPPAEGLAPAQGEPPVGGEGCTPSRPLPGCDHAVLVSSRRYLRIKLGHTGAEEAEEDEEEEEEEEEEAAAEEAELRAEGHQEYGDCPQKY